MAFYGIFLLVADVEVKEDGVFIRLRKETVVCEDKDSSKRVSFSGGLKSVVDEVPVCSGSEAAVSLEAIPEDLTFGSGEAFSLEGVDNIPMEELFCGSRDDGSAAGSSDITSISRYCVRFKIGVLMWCNSDFSRVRIQYFWFP